MNPHVIANTQISNNNRLVMKFSVFLPSFLCFFVFIYENNMFLSLSLLVAPNILQNSLFFIDTCQILDRNWRATKKNYQNLFKRMYGKRKKNDYGAKASWCLFKNLGDCVTNFQNEWDGCLHVFHSNQIKPDWMSRTVASGMCVFFLFQHNNTTISIIT